jgi:drug/metabolite transporter (DMT)-like permease
MDSHARELRGTLIGLTAILMWSTLATLTSYCRAVPPFQLTAMAFTIATMIGLAWMRFQGHSMANLRRLPLNAWLLGVSGLFGFHFFYFMALRHAPVVHASLISYLWPLLIVLMSALLPGEHLRWYHLVGTLAGLLGASLIVTGGSSFALDSAHYIGYGFALLSAFTWSAYSVLSRLFQAVPSYAISGFCAVTALLALICHLFFETTVVPSGFGWLAVLCLGLGPVGGAFFTWDVGVKTGNIKVLGALSYAAPLLSTFLLLALGMAEPSWALGAACLLIVGGSLLASGDILSGLRKRRPAN